MLQAMAQQLAHMKAALESVEYSMAALAAETAALQVRAGHCGAMRSMGGSRNEATGPAPSPAPLHPLEASTFCLQAEREAALDARDAAVREAAEHKAAATEAQDQLSEALANEHAAHNKAKVSIAEGCGLGKRLETACLKGCHMCLL